VHSQIGNKELALSYYRMAIHQSMLVKNPRQLNIAYTGIAEHFLEAGNRDSAIVNSMNAIGAVANTNYFYLANRPSELLSVVYKNQNCDSTIKYLSLHQSAKDALSNSRANQQVQLMTIEEDLRQQEVATQKNLAAEERNQSIQYAMIAIGIVILTILFLVLSHSIIVTEKFISFFAILGLLIIFEFVNLLIHPFLANITHHSPVLMLLVMVLIASILIPIHHRLEKWIKLKMTNKNKMIRLSAAKKMLRELEEPTGKVQ
jgi:hypothetical protein